MKRVTESHHTERIGVHAVASKVHEEFGWLFREQSEDYGIDAEIEVVSNDEPTGRIIAVQIRSGPSYFAAEDDVGIVFRGDSEHLNYWLDHNLPVIVVLYDPNQKVAYWQHVTADTASRLSKGWKMSIPRGQTLDKTQGENLEKIASSVMKEQVRQLTAELQEYRCPYCGAPVAERGGDWVGSEHYGLHEIFECGYHALDGYVERPCPSDPKFPRFEDYELEFHPSQTEGESSWYCIAFPKTDMARKLRLDVCTGRTKEEAERQVRAKYERYAVKRKP